jgi:hypothetical protein
MIDGRETSHFATLMAETFASAKHDAEIAAEFYEALRDFGYLVPTWAWEEGVAPSMRTASGSSIRTAALRSSAASSMTLTLTGPRFG